MQYFVDIEGGRSFPSFHCWSPVGEGFGRTFKVEEAWNGGWVAHTTDSNKKVAVHGDTAIQTWRKMKALLVLQDQWGNNLRKEPLPALPDNQDAMPAVKA